MGTKKQNFQIISRQIIVLLPLLILGVFHNNLCKGEDLQVIKIGGNLSLSGKLAFFGEEQKNGLLLAIDVVNATGGIAGRKIELVIEDNASDAAKAATAIQKLIAVDDAQIITTAFTHTTGAIANVVWKNQRILIYASTMPTFAETNQLTFKDWMTVSTGAIALTKAVEKEQKKRIAILTEISDSCQEMENILKTEFANKGISIIYREEFNPGESDFKPQLLRIKQRKPDAIFGCTWRDSYVFMKQLKELGMINIQTFQWTAPFLPVNDTPIAKQLYEENNTISNWYTWADSSNNPIRKEFEAKNYKRFNKEPRPEAAYIYDDILALAKAAIPCSSPSSFDRECIAKSYQRIVYQGASGLLQFDNNRCSTREVPLIQVKNGHWVNYPLQ